jgi:hypothetical protein
MGGIKGYIKDKTGGTIAGADVALSSSALITPRKADADSAGYFYFQLLPPENLNTYGQQQTKTNQKAHFVFPRSMAGRPLR